jgi:hypothetical protein
MKKIGKERISETHLKEAKDQRSPKTLEYVFGFRESFLPTTTSISLIMTMACGISWLLTDSFEFDSSGAGILQLSLKLISLPAISLMYNRWVYYRAIAHSQN